MPSLLNIILGILMGYGLVVLLNLAGMLAYDLWCGLPTRKG